MILIFARVSPFSVDLKPPAFHKPSSPSSPHQTCRSISSARPIYPWIWARISSVLPQRSRGVSPERGCSGDILSSRKQIWHLSEHGVHSRHLYRYRWSRHRSQPRPMNERRTWSNRGSAVCWRFVALQGNTTPALTASRGVETYRSIEGEGWSADTPPPAKRETHV